MKSIYSSIGLQILKAIPGIAQEIRRKQNLRSLREIICYNQGRLADHYFLANQKHKKLKDKFQEVKQATTPNQVQLEELKRLVDDLSQYLQDNLRNAYMRNFDYVKQLYVHKSHNQKFPRICIKAIREDRIITLVRDNYSNALEQDYPLGANTAFQTINRSNNYYICNDIPHGVRSRSYKNVRIFEDDVFRYYREPNFIDNLRYRFLKTEDEQWQRCWRRTPTPGMLEETPEIQTCYKSTLVVPMTLITDDSSLSDEFRSHFGIGYNSAKVTIGFLCFDHRNKNFFNEDDDVNLGYIFADILSLYLIQNLNCTDYSNIFKEAKSLLHQNNMT